MQRLFISFIAAALFSATAFAQTKPEGEHPKSPGVPVEDEHQKEMIKLFHEVETKLHEIDSILYDAGAGGATKGELKDAGIDRLLQAAAERGRDAHEGIDKILELAQQMQQQQQQQQQSGGDGKPQSQPGGKSPLDKPQGDRPQEREQQGQKPAPRPEDAQDQPQQGGKPKGGQDSKEPPKNSAGVAPPKGPTERAPHGDDRDRWGDLPPQVRDVFRVEGSGDLPPRYRDWIDSYYRRMNRRA